jgi:hypothetical protein
MFSLSDASPSLRDRSGSSVLYSPFASDSFETGFGCDYGTSLIAPASLIPSKRKSDDMSSLEMGVSSSTIPRQCQPKSQNQPESTLLTILRDLRGLKSTVIDLLMAIIDGKGEFKAFHTALFVLRNRDALVGLMDMLVQDKKGRPIVTKWMFPHALNLVCEEIHSEMEAAKPSLRTNTGNVTLEFIEQWDIDKIMGPVAKEITPTLRTIIDTAGESKISCSKPKTAKSKNRHTASLVIMAQLHFLRSRLSAKVPIGLGLQSWACGTSKQMINVLHRTCLVVSYPSILSMVLALADSSIERAKAAALCPHALAYDNINISSSIFVEQGPDAMSKVQSGTFAVIYKLLNARPEDLAIEPMIENLRCSSPLTFSDLRMTLCARQSYASQMAVTICILMEYMEGFETQASNTLLQHTPRRLLPSGHKTIFHPL